MRDNNIDSPVAQLKSFLQALQARRRLFIVITAGVALLAVIGSFFVPKVYEARSTVFIEKNVINSLMKGIVVTPSMEDRIRVLRYYMVSRDIVSRTLKKMEMDIDKRFADPEAFEQLILACQKMTNINMRGDDLFFVSITDKNPFFARDYINTLINIYVEENLSKKREESYGATRFLDEQVSTYKQKLDEVDARILEFRKKTGIYSNVSEASVMADIAKDQEELKAIRVKKNETLATIRTIEQQLRMLKETTALGFNSAMAGSGEDFRIEQLQAKIDELLLVYNDKHPAVVKLNDQIEELKKRRSENPSGTAVMEASSYNPVDDPIFVDLKMRMNSSQSELNALSATEGELAGRVALNQSILRNYPEDKKALNDLERERQTHAEIYDQLLKRMGISDVSKEMEVADKTTTFRIVDPAILPVKPVGMKRILLMLAGVFAGFAAGLGTVYAIEKLDDTVKDSRSLKELGVTVLAEIPFLLTDMDKLLNRKKDKATLVFATVCAGVIGVLLLYDLLGFSFIDRLFTSTSVYRSPYGS